jgi:hypothetical protein
MNKPLTNFAFVVHVWATRTLKKPRDERGDVPGWVMITLMSAGIVTALTAIAGPRLATMLDAALASVGG